MPADLSNEEALDEFASASCRYFEAGSGVAEQEAFVLSRAAVVAAVRATLLASLVEKVEGIKTTFDSPPLDRSAAAFRTDVLTLLRTEAENG